MDSPPISSITILDSSQRQVSEPSVDRCFQEKTLSVPIPYISLHHHRGQRRNHDELAKSAASARYEKRPGSRPGSAKPGGSERAAHRCFPAADRRVPSRRTGPKPHMPLGGGMEHSADIGLLANSSSLDQQNVRPAAPQKTGWSLGPAPHADEKNLRIGQDGAG